MKAQISKEKVEIIKQVRLTSKQRQIIDRMYTNRDRQPEWLDWGVRSQLLGLKLIEERPTFNEKEIAGIRSEMEKMWTQLSKVVVRKDLKAAEKLMSSLREKEASIDKTAYFLTKEGREYCEKGTVQIVR